MAAMQVARLAWGARQAAHLLPVMPRPDPDATRAAAVSAIVPARNEAANIDACLTGLRAQTYPKLEIIVVDDRSTDRTAEIVRQHAAHDRRVRLVQGAPLPDGWIGKCWALHQGTGAAGGEWLLFVDADTRVQPGAITAALGDAERRQAPVWSALTAQDLPTAWERIVMPAVFGSLAEALPIEFVNNPRLPQFALANGQFLLVRRDAYDGIGGHAAIRDEIGEDARFAQRAKRLGWRYWLADGRTLARTRMYTTPEALWEGWTKNLHVGGKMVGWIIPPGLVLFIAALVAPYLTLAQAARERSPSLAAAGAIQLGATLARRRRIDMVYDVPARYTLTEPLGQVAFLALLASSFYKVLSGQGVTWKGRRYYAAGSNSSGTIEPASA